MFLMEYFQKGNIGANPHTIETIGRRTEIPYYELWKQITCEKFGIEILIQQNEFHKI